MVTVDTVVLAGGQAADTRRETSLRVLLVRRGRPPFAGAWALPGGYLEENEDPACGAARELREETGLSGLELRELAFFGAPGRDPRGWTITLAFWTLPEKAPNAVRAGDDASGAGWFTLGELPPLAFDHGAIIARAAAAAKDVTRS